MMTPDVRRLEATYILPLRVDAEGPSERFQDLTDYLAWLARVVDQVVVVDGSPAPTFARHHERWRHLVQHVPPDPELVTENGKVGGVLTGLRRAQHDRLIIADDDVRYDGRSIRLLLKALLSRDVVRPQNHFSPLPWHALWDTARILVNRTTGGDWPGTLGVRRSTLMAAGGYDGRVLFENLELVRTIKAAGGSELVALDLFVPRRPPAVRHFWGQRVRQAYDEFARPGRLAIWLSLLPGLAMIVAKRSWVGLAGAGFAGIAVAEIGRRRGGGRAVFPATASLVAPLWLIERAIGVLLAVAARLALGGMPYRDGILIRAATPSRVLELRHARARTNSR